jgi:aminoglycoside N3'-acetyltransferase
VNPRALLAWLPLAHQDAIKTVARRLRHRAIEIALSYSPQELEAALRRLGVADGDAIVMHSAFSSRNGFAGDAPHVIDCIIDIIGPRGHLFMVSMPYDGTARQYVSEQNVFDVRRTPSQMGLLSESFRRRRGVVRSAHPLHPVLAWGPRAEWVIAGHEDLPHSCGKDSPFEKMLSLDAKALLFDVDIDVLTFTHYLEDLFQDSAPVAVYAPDPLDAEIVDRNGERRRVPVYPFSVEATQRRNFAVLYDAMLDRGLVRRERIGNTVLQLLGLRSLVDAAVGLVNAGTHIYGASDQPVRVKPTRRGTFPGLMAAVREELESRRALGDGKRLANRIVAPFTAFYSARKLSTQAREEIRRDRDGALGDDAGIARCTAAAIAWLCEAQDRSASHDGGVSRIYSLIDGWHRSYPETTGYIVPTLLNYACRTNDDALRARSRRMLDWLVSIQLPEGGFHGGVVGASSTQPVTFNTGQILLGLAAGAIAFGEAAYLEAMHHAALWLVDTQDEDGCWRAFPSPYVAPGEKTYDTHVAWGLFEAARVAPGAGYEIAAIRNVHWALTHQRANGWFGRCCLQDPMQPLTHSIGYALRGVIEAYRFTGDAQFLAAAMKTADALMRALEPDGFLPGRLLSDWSPAVSWSCLTGTSQIALCWLLLHECTDDAKYLEAASRANRYVRRTMRLDGSVELRGGVKGSFPIDGGYCGLEFPNWAAKFTIDANLAELDRVAAGQPCPA